MSPQAAIEIVLYSGVLPAVVAVAAYFACGWLLPQNAARRYRLATAFALAVCAGFAVAPTTKALLPSQFWEWIPYLGLPAAFVAGLARADGVTRGERWLAYVLAAVAAAWVIVPTFARLEEVRTVHVAALAAGIAVLAALLEPLPQKLPGRAFPLWLMLAAGAVAMLVMAEWSETIGRSAALASGALAGCGVAHLLAKSDSDLGPLALPFAVVVGGYAYVGFVYPSPPLIPLLLLPVAPLLLWACAKGPLARVTGFRAVAVQALCALVPLALIVAFVLLRGGGGGDEW